MVVKREHAQALAGLVDTVVNAAADVVDLAEETVTKLDEVVRKGAVVLTNVVDVVDRLSDANEPVGNVRDYFASWLSKNKNINLDYLRSLDLNTIINLYNSTIGDKTTDNTWTRATDDVSAGVKGPVEDAFISNDYKLNYIAKRTTRTYDELSSFEAHIIDGLYESIKRREAAPDQTSAWRNF